MMFLRKCLQQKWNWTCKKERRQKKALYSALQIRKLLKSASGTVLKNVQSEGKNYCWHTSQRNCLWWDYLSPGLWQSFARLLTSAVGFSPSLIAFSFRDGGTAWSAPALFGFPGRQSLRQWLACRVFIWEAVPGSRSGWRGKWVRKRESQSKDTWLRLLPWSTGFIPLILPGPLRVLGIPGLSQNHPPGKWSGWSLIHRLPIPHGLRVCPRECQLSHG